MVLLKSCCYCFDLKTGGIILGWLGMACSTFQIIISSVVMNAKDNHLNISPDKNYEVIKTVASIYLGCSIILLLINTALLWGANKGQRSLLVPWLFTVGILLIIFTLVILVSGAMCLSNEDTAQTGIILIVFYFPQSSVYFWCCVLSLYQELRDEEFAPVNDFNNSLYNASTYTFRV